MCGIAGCLGRKPIDDGLRRRLREALGQLSHRGPDDEHIEEQDGCLFGFRRLAILDLSDSGRQPMLSRDRSSMLAFNGEIYNYVELRPYAEAAGPLHSSGDTEVLLHLLREHQARALPLLNGMFAIAYLDQRTRSFLLARDRLGVKPLYYAVHDDRLFFASELEPLVTLLGFRPEVDPRGIAHYVTFGHIPPPHTIYKGVHKLPPGHVMTGSIDDVRRATPREWWWLTPEVRPERPAERWLEEIEGLLEDAVRIRLRSDVPVGVFLSGGIDSGLVAHYTAQQAGENKPLALTVTFDEKEYSEEDVASAVARANGLEHELIRVEAGNLSDLPRIARVCGEPFQDASVLNQYHLARVARQHATVFLSGDGGDESFAGYPEYLRVARQGGALRMAAHAVAPTVGVLDRVLGRDTLHRARLWRLSAAGGDFAALARQNVRDPWIRDLLRDGYRQALDDVEQTVWKEWRRSEGLPLVTRMQRLDLRLYLESDVLTKVDRATMAHSIEVRSPFLDYRMVELGGRIPVQQQVDLANGHGKTLLRRLAQQRLPGDTFSKPKHGFGLPVRDWTRGVLAGPMEELLTGPQALLRDWVDLSTVRELLRANLNPARATFGAHQYVWRLAMLEVWARCVRDGQTDTPLSAASPSHDG